MILVTSLSTLRQLLFGIIFISEVKTLTNRKAAFPIKGESGFFNYYWLLSPIIQVRPFFQDIFGFWSNLAGE